MVEKRIVCVTSTSCLSYAPERYKNLGIEQFHIVVNYNNKDYLEGLDLDPKEFFKTLETLEDPKNHLPHSAIPSFESIREKFQSIVDKGYTEAIIITLSSYLGGTFNAIQLVAKEFEEQLKTTMIDSKITGFNEGLLAIQAKELVDKGVDTETIVKEIKWSMAHQEFIGVCGSLDYLVYNGRLKGGKAFISKLIHICPVMHFSHEGVLEAFATAVGTKKGAKMAVAKVKELVSNLDPNDYILFRNYSGEHSADMLKEFEEQYDLKPNHEDMIVSPVIGCHVGPYLASYGLFIKRKPEQPLE